MDASSSHHGRLKVSAIAMAVAVSLAGPLHPDDTR
jgi:hypothetical protein